MVNKTKTWSVQGPKNRYGSASVLEVGSRSWQTQRRPWVHPLPFTFALGRLTNVMNTSEYVYRPSDFIYSSSYAFSSKFAIQARNSAYDSFVKRSKADQAQLLTLLAERKKTWDMIILRLTNLTAGLIAAKTGNVHALKQAWGKHADVRSNLRKTGSHVLEYSFGWAPLVNDVVSGVKVVANGVPPVRVKGSSRGPVRDRTWVKAPVNYNGGFFYNDEWTARMGATLSVSNPNVALANQLGLLNPLTTAWELVPWSFVVDYFVNTGDFIASFTDFAGFDLTDGWTTTCCKQSVSGSTIYKFDDPVYQGGSSLYGFSGEAVHINRVAAIVKPVFTTRPRVGMPIQRAATSVALLLQQLRTR